MPSSVRSLVCSEPTGVWTFMWEVFNPLHGAVGEMGVVRGAEIVFRKGIAKRHVLKSWRKRCKQGVKKFRHPKKSKSDSDFDRSANVFLKTFLD